MYKNSVMLPLQFEEVFEETRGALTAALGTQHYGVIHALTIACNRLAIKQASCIKVYIYFLFSATGALNYVL